MGKDLVQYFPWTKNILKELDDVLQSLPHPPRWSLISELTETRTPEHLRQPEFSQPLVTALQLCIISVLESWDIKPTSTVGHSLGEIAAAYAAGLLDRAGAITAAYYRGRAAVNMETEEGPSVGMLAAWIACFNGPNSVTVSGKVAALEALRDEVQAAGGFARLLQVDLAYYSRLMGDIADEYEKLLGSTDKFRPLTKGYSDGAATVMYSSVTESQGPEVADAAYWKANMVSPVRFDAAVRAMLEADGRPSHLIEIGPSGALSGPVSQILKSIPSKGQAGGGGDGEVSYLSAWARGGHAGKQLFDLAGHLWVSGAPIDLAAVNGYNGKQRTIQVDLPNYHWNHSTKYWHENQSSKEWRFRKYPVHDLLGSKVIGAPWHAPVWRHRLNVSDLPYLQDPRIGGSVILPGAGYVTMAVEAMYQKHCALLYEQGKSDVVAKNDLCYRFRDVRFRNVLVLEEGKAAMISLALTPVASNPDWHSFRIWSTDEDQIRDHAFGLVRVQDPIDEEVPQDVSKPFKAPQFAKLWYDCLRDAGVDFGPRFQRILEVEAVPGHRECRTILSMEPPPAKHSPQAYYPVHPAALDGCVQTSIPSSVECDRANKEEIYIPSLVDEVIVNKASPALKKAVAKGTSVYSGRGRSEAESSWLATSEVYDTEAGQLLVKFKNIRYVRLDAPPAPDPHTFDWAVWKPDIELLEEHQVTNITMAADEDSCDRLHTIIDLAAHKKPALNVLEVHVVDDYDINAQDSESESIWFSLDGGKERSARAAFSRFDFCSTNPTVVVEVENQHGEQVNTGFHTVDINSLASSLPEETSYV
ncbi:hypothetical protein diail_1913 [Diaporthe ilicicola]|nr:hypothetical protein diail_1913 [Diaporthe ilicicola]